MGYTPPNLRPLVDSKANAAGDNVSTNAATWRTAIDALKTDGPADSTTVTQTDLGAGNAETRILIAKLRDRRSLLDFKGPTTADRLQRAIAWLNGGTSRLVVVPNGDYTLPSGGLDPITGVNKALVGDKARATRFILPSGGAAATFARIGDGTAGSANRVRFSSIELINQNLGPASHAIIVDGANDVDVFVPNALSIAGFLSIGATAFVNRLRYQLDGGSWRPQDGASFVHQKRGNTISSPKAHCLATAAGAAGVRAFLLEAIGNNDGLYIDDQEVWSSLGIETAVEINPAGGQVVNTRFRGCVLDQTTVAAVIIKKTASFPMRHAHFLSCRSTPLSGRCYDVTNVGGGNVMQDIVVDNAIMNVQDAAAVRVQGQIDGWRVAGQIDYADFNSPFAYVRTLAEIGSSDGKVDIRSGSANEAGQSNYDYAVETIADVDNLTLVVKDTKAQVAPIKHFAYVSGGQSIEESGTWSGGAIGQELRGAAATATETVAAKGLNRVRSYDATAGALIVTLPDPATLRERTWVTIRKSDTSANRVTTRFSGSATDQAWLSLRADEATFWVRGGVWVARTWRITPLSGFMAASGTLTVPPLISLLRYGIRSGSGGGGSGARQPAGTAAFGGHGGNGANFKSGQISAAELTATVAIVVGAAGAGGAAVAADATNGNAGTAGALTSIGATIDPFYDLAPGASGGPGGTTAAQAQPTASGQERTTGQGAVSSSTAGIGANPAYFPGGGSGGSISAANVSTAGGLGRDRKNAGIAAGATPGGAGVSGSAEPAIQQMRGGEGASGGGAGDSATAGGSGGAGTGGGGGGGGGASRNGFASGKGGDGSAGRFDYTFVF